MFGGDRNTIHLVDADTVEDWPVMTKQEIAARLATRIADRLAPDATPARVSPRVPGAARPAR